MKLIADTGLLVAFLNRRDSHHRWAVAMVEEAEFPIVTCEAVITESAWHLQDSEILLQLIDQNTLAIEFELKKDLEAISQLAKRYSDLDPDLGDLCVVRLSERFVGHNVATVDRRHFEIYRRFGRQAIPFVCPF